MGLITALGLTVVAVAMIGMANWAPRNKRLQIDLTRKSREAKKKPKQKPPVVKEKKTVPDDWVCIGTLGKIIIYPIDDGYGILSTKAHCTRHGLATDTSVHWRGYRYKENGSQRGFHDRTVVAYQDKSRRVIVKNPNVRLLHDRRLQKYINFQLQMNLYSLDRINNIAYENYTRRFIVYDLGYDISDYIRGTWSDTYGLRLGYRQRDCRTTWNSSMRKFFNNHPRKAEWTLDGFSANFSSYSLVNTKHIEVLRKKCGRNDISFWNFRPNLVVEGNGTPYFEENIIAVKIANVEFAKIIPCTHTSSINNDISRNTEKFTDQPFNYLSENRKLCDVHPELSSTLTSPVFGINMELQIQYTKKGLQIMTAPGEITLKDLVYVKFKKIVPPEPRPGPSILKKR